VPINKNEITKEMIAKAMQCETAEDFRNAQLINLAANKDTQARHNV